MAKSKVNKEDTVADDKVKQISEDVKITLKEKHELENKVLLVNVGNDIHPADEEMIEDVAKTFGEFLEKNQINCFPYVTNHTVSITIVDYVN